MLRTRITARIDESGPMPFEEFMAACLYDPEAGFFAAGPLRSVKSGDFLTSPEVSPWFGRMLARFVGRLGSPVVVDAGAGSGSLLGSLLEASGPGVIAHAVEVSAAARDALGGLLPEERIHHDLATVAHLGDGMILCNELLDNLPVSLAVRSGSSWEERWVGRDDGALALVPVDARPEVAAWCDAHAGTVPEGGLVEVQLAAGAWLAEAIGLVDRGAVVAIDYGGTAEELEPRRTQGTLRTYRAHHLGPDPLLEPGATDITVDVNFTALIAVAEAAGAQVALHRQDDFLTDLGLRDEIARLRREENEEAAAGDPMRRLQLRAERIDAETLLHPRGLGDFRVLVVTK